jgi:hypothetical protein
MGIHATRVGAVSAMALVYCFANAQTSAAAGAIGDQRDAVEFVNCSDLHIANLPPQGDGGPLRLNTLYCQDFAPTSYPRANVVVSPDARLIAFEDFERRFVRVAALNSTKATTAYALDLGTFATIASFGDGRPSFQWSADSRFLWAATQLRMRPLGGWALAPLKPVRAQAGQLKPLPNVEHAAGPLDGILWAGSGNALALFGARGGYYRPEHDDPNPTLAIVDAQRGVVLDSVRLTSAPLTNVEATTLPDGRVRAVYGTKEMRAWTQGERPISLSIPVTRGMSTALSKDGMRLLVMRDLRVESSCTRSGSKCWQGPPVSGDLAALYDLPNGRMLWTIQSDIDAPGPRAPIPEISPDGKYALIGLPSAFPTHPARFAFISMRDGSIIQTIRAPGDEYTFGFAQQSDTVWAHRGGTTVIYRWTLERKKAQAH